MSLFCYLYRYSVHNMSEKSLISRHRYIREDKNDKRDIIKSMIEWTGFVLVVFIIAIVALTVFLRVQRVYLGTSDTTMLTVAATPPNASFDRGDDVIYDGCCVTVFGVEGDDLNKIEKKTGRLSSLVYRDEIYSRERFDEIFTADNTLPEGLVLADARTENGENTATVISSEAVQGRVRFVLYPLIYFGKSIEGVREQQR